MRLPGSYGPAGAQFTCVPNRKGVSAMGDGKARESVLSLKERMGRSIIGQESMIERLLLDLLAKPGLAAALARTRTARLAERTRARRPPALPTLNP